MVHQLGEKTLTEVIQNARNLQ